MIEINSPVKYLTKQSKRNKILTGKIPTLVVVIITTLMVVSTLTTNAHALPILSVRGVPTGTFICGDGTVHTNSFLQIDAGHFSKSQGQSQKVGGQWNVVDREANNGDGGFISGTFYGGKMGKTSFNLLAIYNHVEGICDNDPIPAKGTISGQCGLNARIEVQFENGAHGTFSGSINCI